MATKTIVLKHDEVYDMILDCLSIQGRISRGDPASISYGVVEDGPEGGVYFRIQQEVN